MRRIFDLDGVHYIVDIPRDVFAGQVIHLDAEAMQFIAQSHELCFAESLARIELLIDLGLNFGDPSRQPSQPLIPCRFFFVGFSVKLRLPFCLPTLLFLSALFFFLRRLPFGRSLNLFSRLLQHRILTYDERRQSFELVFVLLLKSTVPAHQLDCLFEMFNALLRLARISINPRQFGVDLRQLSLIPIEFRLRHRFIERVRLHLFLQQPISFKVTVEPEHFPIGIVGFLPPSEQPYFIDQRGELFSLARQIQCLFEIRRRRCRLPQRGVHTSDRARQLDQLLLILLDIAELADGIISRDLIHQRPMLFDQLSPARLI